LGCFSVSPSVEQRLGETEWDHSGKLVQKQKQKKLAPSPKNEVHKPVLSTTDFSEFTTEQF